MRRKKILAVIPSISFYGKERANFEVYKLLGENEKIQLSIIVNRSADKRLLTIASMFHSYKIIFPERSNHKYKYLRYLFHLFISNLWFIYLLFKIRPHILYLCTENTFYDFFIPLAFVKSKIIYRIGDEPSFPKLTNYKFNSFVWNKLVCKKVDTFVCVSKYILDKVNELGRISSNDKVIYSFPPTRYIISKLDFDFKFREQPHIGYIGQITPEKGVDMLLEAAIRILNEGYSASFYFAGKLDYDPEFSHQIERIHLKSEYTDKIFFLGEVDDLNTFLDNMDFICIPSVKEEPLANVLIEAKGMKKPCIIFKSGGLPELITHKVDGLICEERTVDSLINEILYYIKSPEIVDIHSKNSYDSINNLAIDYNHYVTNWNKVFI